MGRFRGTTQISLLKDSLFRIRSLSIHLKTRYPIPLTVGIRINLMLGFQPIAGYHAFSNQLPRELPLFLPQGTPSRWSLFSWRHKITYFPCSSSLWKLLLLVKVYHLNPCLSRINFRSFQLFRFRTISKIRTGFWSITSSTSSSSSPAPLATIFAQLSVSKLSG